MQTSTVRRRWLPHRLSKRQSPTIVLLRTTLTRTITLYELQLNLFGFRKKCYYPNLWAVVAFPKLGAGVFPYLKSHICTSPKTTGVIFHIPRKFGVILRVRKSEAISGFFEQIFTEMIHWVLPYLWLFVLVCFLQWCFKCFIYITISFEIQRKWIF